MVVIGNSMGGLVARSLFVPSENVDFDTNLVNTIITQASPHVRPVINYDLEIDSFYSNVNSLWQNKSEMSLQNVILVALYGGVRDILVRSGQANVNSWKNFSAATILTSQTTSVPQVWRSIDHRCMAWCRELVLTTNRALFDLVDTKTTFQIIESKQIRENVIRFHFERGVYSGESNKEDLNYDELLHGVEMVENIDVLTNTMFLNEDRTREKVYVFNMNLILDSFRFDSMFVYTNLNKKHSFVLCKSFADNQCKSYKDLAVEFGRLIPPYVETERHMTLKTINVVDFRKLVINEKYQYMLINVPKSDANTKKLFFKFDFYLNDYRIESNLNEKKSFRIKNSEAGIVFRRIYLPFMRHVWQAYDLNRIVDKESVCDHYLSMSLNKKPLATSCLMVQFYEQVQHEQVTSLSEHVYHSQAIQTKSKNLTLRLTQSVSDANLAPYVDLIQFELKHLLPAGVKKEQTSIPSIYRIEILVNYSAMLGQFVRFYAICVPAFLVFIVEVYYAISVFFPAKKEYSYTRHFFLLNTFTVSFLFHLFMSVLIAFLVYIFPVNDYFDDIQDLANSNISFNFVIAFILYWLAYSILNLFSFVLSFLIFGLNLITFNRVGSLSNNQSRNLTFPIIHLVLTLILGYYMSTLALVSIFIFQLINLARARSKLSIIDRSSLHYLDAKLVLSFLLIVFNGPGLVVWVKMQEIESIFSLKTMSSVLGDIGQIAAVFSVFIHILDLFLFDKIIVKSNQIISKIIKYTLFINSFLTLVYSLSSFYRLQYFSLVHLTFASIERLIQTKTHIDLKKD